MASLETFSDKPKAYPEMSDTFNAAASLERSTPPETEAAERGKVVKRISGADFLNQTGIDGRKLVPSSERAKIDPDLEKRREKMDAYYDSTDEAFEEIDRIESVPFRAPNGDEKKRARENEKRMARKLTVALLTRNPNKLKAPDYPLNGESDFLVESLSGLDEEQVDFIGDQVLSQISTAVRKKGAETVYSELSEDSEATENLYGWTYGWRERDKNNELENISKEDQKKLGGEMIEELLETYPTALSFYREILAESAKRRDSDEDYSKREKFEESALRLGRMIYGTQFTYAEVFDDYIADEVRFKKLSAPKPEKSPRREPAPEVAPPEPSPEKPLTPPARPEEKPAPRAPEPSGRRMKYRDFKGVAGIKRNPDVRPEIASLSPDSETAEEDTKAARAALEKLEREKAEVEAAKLELAKKKQEEEAKKAAEEAAKAARKKEVLEARAEASKKFNVKLTGVRNPEEVWERTKKTNALVVSGGELIDFFAATEDRSAETAPRRYSAKDFEALGLIPTTVGEYALDDEKRPRFVAISNPFKISGGDRGVGVLIWKKREMSEKGKAKTGKTFKLIPEVYYKRDMDSDKRWLKVKGFAQRATLGPGLIDYDFMEAKDENGEYTNVEETNEGLSSVLDDYASDSDEFDYIPGGRTVGDLIIASASKQKAAVRADVRSRSGVSRILLEDSRRS